MSRALLFCGVLLVVLSGQQPAGFSQKSALQEARRHHAAIRNAASVVPEQTGHEVRVAASNLLEAW